jgi:hypothetical protein
MGRPVPLPHLFLRMGLFAVIRLDTLLLSSKSLFLLEKATVSRMIDTCSASSDASTGAVDPDMVSEELMNDGIRGVGGKDWPPPMTSESSAYTVVNTVKLTGSHNIHHTTQLSDLFLQAEISR